MTPNHAVFRGLWLLCEGVGNVTDYVDGNLERVNNQPLIYLGETSNSETTNTDLNGTVNYTIHIYGLLTDRKRVDEVYVYIRNGMLKGIEEFGYSLSRPSVRLRVLQDNSTEKRLLHYVVEYEATYTK